MKHRIIEYLRENVVNKSLKVLFLRIGGVFFFFALSLFLTNFYDAAIVGRYDFSRATLLILGGICMLGTNQSIIYYSGKFKAENSLGSLRRVYLKMVLIILGVAIFFIALLSLVPSGVFNNFFEKPDADELLFKIVISLSAFALSMLNIDAMRALDFPLFSELYRNIFRYFPFFLAAVILFYTGQTMWLVEVYLLGFVVLAGISSLQLFVAFNKKEKKSLPQTNVTYKEILNKSYPMALSAVTYFLMQSTDILLLGKFSNFDTVAYYAVAVKLATVTSLALQSVNVIIAPRIAEMFSKKDRSELKKTVRLGTRLIFALSLPALIVLALFAAFFLGLFGEAYVLARNGLLILLIGQFFNTLCGPVAIYLNMTGRQHKLQQILMFGFALNLILNWFLIPVYGMSGAAIGTAISMVVWNAIAVSYTYRVDRVKTFLS